MTNKEYKKEKKLVKSRSLGGMTLCKWMLLGALILGLIILFMMFFFTYVKRQIADFISHLLCEMAF